jgi:hypothetical protein
MKVFCCHDLTLGVTGRGLARHTHLAEVLQALSFRPAPMSAPASICLHVRHGARPVRLPATSRRVLITPQFEGYEHADAFFLTDGRSLVHLRPSRGRADARLAPSFFDKSGCVQRNFWAFCLLKLLQPLGLYSLHAAGLIAPDEAGLLVVGRSGSGKSTLALGLIRRGWRYLSDDAVLVREVGGSVGALALRTHFYIDAGSEDWHRDLPLGALAVDAEGRQRRRVLVEQAFPAGFRPRCVPHVLLFPRIAGVARSVLRPVDNVTALKRLLSASGTQLLQARFAEAHISALTQLMRQSARFELEVGRDLLDEPLVLERLLRDQRAPSRAAAAPLARTVPADPR